MLNTGFGYQAWNAKRGAAPSPAQMGAHLQQQQASQAQPAGMPSLGMGSLLQNTATPGDDEGQLDLDGQSLYDPTIEHSASSTRAALEDAIRRSKDLGNKPALKRPAAPNQSWQLATLGLSPLEIALFTQTGDAAGGVG